MTDHEKDPTPSGPTETNADGPEPTANEQNEVETNKSGVDRTNPAPAAPAQAEKTESSANNVLEKREENAEANPGVTTAAAEDTSARQAAAPKAATPAAPATAPASPTTAVPTSGDSPAKPAPAAKPAATTAKPAASGASGATAKPAGAPAAKKAPPPPDPRAEAAKAEAEKLKAAIVIAFPDAVEEVGAAHFKPMVRIRKEDWAATVDYLKSHKDWQLNYVECMAGTDYPDYIEIVLFIHSTALNHFVCLKTRTERNNAEVPSVSHVYPAVNWEEREIYDLLGVTFTKHPDLRRIMMWDEFTGHPLRKDYNEWDTAGEDATDGAD